MGRKLNTEIYKSPLKAIKAHCLQCSCDNYVVAKECVVTDCYLYPYRLGKNPFRTKRELSDEQRQIMAERLRNAREKPKESADEI